MRINRREFNNHESLTLDYPPILKKILANRNIKSEDDLVLKTKDLLHFRSLKDIDIAANIVADVIQLNQKIVIVGDFDADGATSTALCILCLKAMGHINLDYIVPNRFDYGYGLTSPVVDMAMANGADLLITVDNGISSLEGVSYAKKCGLKVVVTDHHLQGDTLPNADAIVNPNQKSCQFESKHIAGVGVAFYTMLAIKSCLTERNYFENCKLPSPNLAEYLDIVAVGTVADVVPLDKNNRILVHQGILRIRAGKARPGILALLQQANKNYQKCCSSDIGFAIGPRLNAAGRLQDMSCGIECLLTEDINIARQLSVQLDALNQSRKEIESEMKELAEKVMSESTLSIDQLPASIVMYDASFHQGVIGILAGRLKEKYYRPTIVFADDGEKLVKGSARSIPGIHIRDILAAVDVNAPGLIRKFGGHAMAAGLSIHRNDIQSFKNILNEQIRKTNGELPKEAILLSDGELPETDFNLEIASTLKYSFPWGQGFDEPVFDGMFELVNQRIVGQKHLKMVLQKGQQVLDAIAFNIDTDVWPNEEITLVNIAYKLDINEYRGQLNPQLIVSLLEPSGTFAE